VGYVSLGDTTPEADACPANSDTRISLPLFKETEAVGVVAEGGVTATTIAADGAAYGVNDYAGYYCTMTSGANEGQILLVTSNTADTLTVAPSVGDTTGITDADTFNLSPAWTIGSLLPAPPVGTQLLAYAGSASGVNLPVDLIYAYGQPFGGALFPAPTWYNTSTYAQAINVPLFPGEALIVRTGEVPISELVITGSVPSVNTYVLIAGGAGQQDSPLSFVSPVDEPVISAGIPAVPGDQIFLYDNSVAELNKAPTTIYAYGQPFGGALFPTPTWHNSSTYAALTTEALPAGSTFVYRTAGAAADVILSDEPDYVSGL